MIARGSVTRLVVAVTALCAVVSLASVTVVVALGLKAPVKVLVGEAVGALMGGAAGAACRAAGGWDEALPNGDRVTFYDRATLAAAPLPAAAREALVREGAYMGAGLGGRRLMAVVVGEAGPCTVYTHHWTGGGRFARWFLVGLPLAVGAVAALAALLGAWLIARPLRRRVDRLAAAAACVGAEAAYPGADVGGADELGRVGRALDDAHQRLREDRALLLARQRALEDDLSALAHDTNTPLTALFMALEQLTLERDPAALQSQAEAALGDAVYLSSLIQNLAVDRRLAGGQPLPTEGQAAFDLAEIIARVGQRAARLARPLPAAVDVAHPDGPVWVQGHPTLVEQALMNVAQNAVAAVRQAADAAAGGGGAGGQVLMVLERESAGFHLWIADDGPGLDPQDTARALERGWRSAEARAARPHGSGLGLATTAAVCARHGFSLTLVGRGALGGLEVHLRGPCAP